MPKSRVKLKQYGIRVNGVLIRKSFGSSFEARKWQREQKKIQDEIRAGSRKHLAPILFSMQAIEFLASRRDMESFSHQETWMGKYILTRPKFQDKFLHEISKAMWKEVFGKNGELVVEHKLGPATHNRIRAMVHKMYEDARREYEPPRAVDNPIHDIDPLPEPKRQPQILATAGEVGRYIQAAYQDRLFPCWGIYVAIKLNTGMRMQNIIPLRWRDWSPDGNVLMAREKLTRSKGFKSGSKTDSAERKVGVNPVLKAALEDWKAITAHSDPDDFIVALADGSHITTKRIWDANSRTIKAAGLPYLSEHKLRHTYASHYLAAGGSIHDLKLNLFHSTVTTTEIYSHALESELSRRANAFQTAKVPKREES